MPTHPTDLVLGHTQTTRLYGTQRGQLAPIPAHVRRPRVLSWGMGVDSSAALMRWLTDPASRDWPLSDLTVLVAHTGDEWASTLSAADRHILPALRHHGVRLVQLARRGPSHTQDGVVVLDDSTQPTRLHGEGAYTLADEMLAAGTLPQSGGARICSVHSKGEVLDAAIDRLTQGRPYEHLLGFEVNEAKRAEKDAKYNTTCRTGAYPLIAWGWDRAACVSDLRQRTGATFIKSACSYCPFALASVRSGSRDEVLSRFASEQAPADLALTMETTATALNPRQGLLAGRRLLDLVRSRADLRHTLARFQGGLEHREHALYRVRRVLRPRKDDPTKLGNAVRSIQVMATGTRGGMRAALRELARRADRRLDTTDPDHQRLWIHRRGADLPAREQFIVVAPHTAQEKTGRGFDQAWAKAAQAKLW